MTHPLMFSKVEKALHTLHLALEPPPANDRERDGAIQRFEYCFELTWKTAKKVLENQGIHSTSPKTVIRDIAQQGWISNPELWMEFLESRNLTSHTYEEANAIKVFASVLKFYPEAMKLLSKLKAL